MAFFPRFLLWYGVVFGILDWLSDIVYLISKQIESEALKNAVAAFIVLQPILYVFVHAIYMASHTTIENYKDRMVLVSLSPVYAILQYTKLLSAHGGLHKWFVEITRVGGKLKLISLENCFKVGVFIEFFLQTVPQMVIQVTINNSQVWDAPAKFSFAMAVMLFIRDVTLITLYIIKKFIDASNGEEPLIRP